MKVVSLLVLGTGRLYPSGNIPGTLSTVKQSNLLMANKQNLTITINEEIPDDGLKGSKHVGLFIKSVLSDFSVT